jgi:hypothetical protein
MADMQEGNTNIPEFTGKASTCRLCFKTKLFTDLCLHKLVRWPDL